MVTRRRIKVVEMAGSQLSHILPNTNPWAGSGCSRSDCHTCHQGGGQDIKEDCFRRNILYESHCGTCADREGGEEKERRPKNGEKFKRKGIYVGETSRSLYERCKEHHLRGVLKREEDSDIAKLWEDCHQGEEMPTFRFKIVKSFQDCLSRQVSESVRIDMRTDPLNSKTMYSRNRLPRLELEKTEWEKEDEMRKKKREDW